MREERIFYTDHFQWFEELQVDVKWRHFRLCERGDTMYLILFANLPN